MNIFFSGDNEGLQSCCCEALVPGVGIMLSYIYHRGKDESDRWRIVNLMHEHMTLYYSGGEQEMWRKEVHPRPMLSSYGYLREKGDGGDEQVRKTGGCVSSHFLDSGAFTLWTRARKYAEENHCSQWDFYDTPDFWQYADDYAEFVKKYSEAITLYANLDAIPNPVLSWRNQKYLENKHGLKPVPVVHRGTNLKWLKRYIDAGYEYVGLGGMVGTGTSKSLSRWLDECFEVICDTPDRTPRIKVHGFGVTSYKMLINFPWWSVDSVTWAKAGGFGRVLVPHKRNGKFDFGQNPYIIVTSVESNKINSKTNDEHTLTLSPLAKRVLTEWLDEIGIPLGEFELDKNQIPKKDKDGNPIVITNGVITRHTERRAANILFFERLCQWLPEWPWPLKKARAPRNTMGF